MAGTVARYAINEGRPDWTLIFFFFQNNAVRRNFAGRRLLNETVFEHKYAIYLSG